MRSRVGGVQACGQLVGAVDAHVFDAVEPDAVLRLHVLERVDQRDRLVAAQLLGVSTAPGSRTRSAI